MNRYNKRSAGRPAYKKLFKEIEGGESAPYSLREFHSVFMECMDASEYKPAILLLGDWEEWCKMKENCLPFREEVESWVKEVKVKLYSESLLNIKVIADGTSKASFSANKYFADTISKEAERNDKKKAGRPSNKVKADTKDLSVITKEELERVKNNIHLNQ